MMSNSMVVLKSSEPKSDPIVQNLGKLLRNLSVRGDGTVMENSGVIGVLEVHMHQATDIHNICIYHKQDVYAKLYMTSDPNKSVSTQIVHGGGRNPVFDENLCLDVRTVDSSLKCEIWMFSRIRNYLEDQLLGFALVPLSDVLAANEKLAQAFSLFACDLDQTPSGSVELSLTYSGASPEIMDITSSSTAKVDGEGSVPCELNRIEFPDPEIVKENHMMVSECFGVSQSCESLSNAEDDDDLNEIGVRLVQGFSNGNPTAESVPSSNSVNGSPSVSASATSQSPNRDIVPSEGNGEIRSGLARANIENDQMVVQQEIVEMYLKSMEQFSASLANMNLPVNAEGENSSEERTSSDEKLQGQEGKNSRLFYGSRAFF